MAPSEDLQPVETEEPDAAELFNMVREIQHPDPVPPAINAEHVLLFEEQLGLMNGYRLRIVGAGMAGLPDTPEGKRTTALLQLALARLHPNTNEDWSHCMFGGWERDID